MSEDIEISRNGRVQVIRLNRPAKKNAMTAAMYKAMTGALHHGDASPEVSAHVFLGLPGMFTAGNDMHDFLAAAQGGASRVEDVLNFVRALPKVTKPLVAGVCGFAVGVGVTMLFHFDLVYASPLAAFSTPFLNLGLVPEAGSSLIAPQLMGHRRAFEMLVLGEPFPAERALAAGLVNEIVPADSLEEKAIGAAALLASKPPQALAIARKLLRGGGADISKRIEEEAALFKERLTSPEALEAFRAFLEKRAPDFSRFQGNG